MRCPQALLLSSNHKIKHSCSFWMYGVLCLYQKGNKEVMIFLKSFLIFLKSFLKPPKHMLIHMKTGLD